MALSKIDTAAIADDAVVAAAIAANAVGSSELSVSTGKVLQVKQVDQKGRLTLTATSYTTVSGLSVSITPSSTSNKILLIAHVEGSGTDRYNAFRFYRGSTPIGIGNAGSSEERMSFSFDCNPSSTHDQYVNHNAGMTFLDSPSTTSATTYTVKFRRTHGSGTYYINRSTYVDTAYAYTRYPISSLMVMEIAG